MFINLFNLFFFEIRFIFSLKKIQTQEGQSRYITTDLEGNMHLIWRKLRITLIGGEVGEKRIITRIFIQVISKPIVFGKIKKKIKNKT